MKKIIVLLASIIYAMQLNANDTRIQEVNNSFEDKIMDIKIVDGITEVSFERYAVIYKLDKKNKHYTQLLNKLNELKKIKKKAKITVTIPSMEIKEVKE